MIAMDRGRKIHGMVFALAILYWVLGIMGVLGSLSDLLTSIFPGRGTYTIDGGWLFIRALLLGLAWVVILAGASRPASICIRLAFFTPPPPTTTVRAPPRGTAGPGFGPFAGQDVERVRPPVGVGRRCLPL